MLCSGALALLAFSVFQNVGMTIGLIPSRYPAPVRELRWLRHDRFLRYGRARGQRRNAPVGPAMSPMGTDEDAVEADPGSEAMTRANGDGSAFASGDALATEATWTSDVGDVAGLDGPEASEDVTPEVANETADVPLGSGSDLESSEPSEQGELAEPAALDEPAADRDEPGSDMEEPSALDEPAADMYEELDRWSPRRRCHRWSSSMSCSSCRRLTQSWSFRRRMHLSASCGSLSVAPRVLRSAMRQGGSRPRGRLLTNCSRASSRSSG